MSMARASMFSSPARPSAPMVGAVLVALAGASAVHAAELSPSTFATLTSVITVALGRHDRLDVLASADVRRAIELEGDKRALGCAEQTSCLAEVAGAMGARLVVFGQLGDLDGELVLTLNLYDSQSATAVGRVLERAPDSRRLAEKLEPAVDRLLARTLAAAKPGERLRILVLDLEAGAPAAVAPAPTPTSTSAPASSSTPWLLYGAGATAGVAALAVGVGAVLGGLNLAELDAGTKEPFAAKALEHDQVAQVLGLGANAAFLACAGALVVAASLGAAHLMVGGPE